MFLHSNWICSQEKKNLKMLQDLCEQLKSSNLLMNDVQLEDTIVSEGKFIVKNGLHKTAYVAAKFLRQDCRSIERFKRECDFALQVLLKSDTRFHPNVLRIHGFACIKDWPYLIMESMPKPLSEFIQENMHHAYYKEELKVHIARDIANGLNSQYLHSYAPQPAYIHCGLTCDNILLTAGMRAKISNFSRIRQENDKLPDFNNELRSYYPPEVLYQKSVISRKVVDMYSFAKVVYYIMTNTLPSLTEPDKGYNQVAFTKAASKDHDLHTVAKEIFDKDDPEKRMSAEQAFSFLNNAAGQVIRPSVLNPLPSEDGSNLVSIQCHACVSFCSAGI